MNAIAELRRMPETKSQRETFVNACVDEILSGNQNPLEIEIILKNMEETIKAIRKDERVKDAIMKEINDFSEKSFTFGNVLFTKKASTTYDYKHDGEWCRLNEKIKEREALLKTIKEPLADANTGELIQPAIKKSTDTYSITFNK
jgi:hypothetical protein